MKRYAVNTYDREIVVYNISGELTDFPRGLFLAYADYLVTGLESKHEAEGFHACPHCKGSVPGKVGELCFRCKTPLVERI